MCYPTFKMGSVKCRTLCTGESKSKGTFLKHKIGEKYSQAQQYILQLYNCHRMLVFLRHVSTHFPSHPQTLHNLRLITVKYLRKCVRDLTGLQYLS
jgi:hypothetical protein